MKNTEALEQLVDALRCLPGIGPKSALRMAQALLLTQSNWWVTVPIAITFLKKWFAHFAHPKIEMPQFFV